MRKGTGRIGEYLRLGIERKLREEEKEGRSERKSGYSLSADDLP